MAGIQDILNGAANSGHTHAVADVEGLEQLVFAVVATQAFQILPLHELLVDTTASLTLLAPANPVDGETYFNIADKNGTAADNPPTIDWGVNTYQGDTSTILDINNFSFRFAGGEWRAY